MGMGHVYQCKTCGYSGELFLDYGMLYEEYCEEVKQNALDGKMGQSWQKYVAEHPDGAFDCEKAVYACSCGGFRNVPHLDYYLPKEGCKFSSAACGKGERRNAGAVKHYLHRCPKCRKKMRPIGEEEYSLLKCPECGGELDYLMEAIMWD